MPRSRDERGAVAVVLALVTCFVLVPLAALGVDIGVQRVARQDMQSLADMVALDLGRGITGGKLGSYSVAELEAAAAASKTRNSAYVGSDAELEVALGVTDPAKSGQADYFTELTDPDAVPTAVRVTASTSVKHTFAPGDGGATRQAIAEARSTACFRIGTFALRLAGNRSALNGMLGNALGLGVLGYDGLANANVSLLGIATELGVAGPNELVDLNNVSIGQLVAAMGTVLSNSPGHDLADVTLLNTIRTGLVDAGTSGRLVDMGKLLDVGTGSSGLDASVNLLDLLSTAAFVANGDNAISVPGLGLSLPGVGNLAATLKVVEAPRIGCGDGTATTGQVALTLDGQLATGVCPSGGLSLVLKLCVEGPIRVSLDLAEAHATLAAVSCVSGSATSLTIDVVNEGLASTRIALGTVPPANSALRVKAGLLGLGLLDIPLLGLGVQTTQSDPGGSYVLDPWTSYVDTPYRTPQTPRPLPSLGNADLQAVGLNVSTLLSPVLALLNPVVGALDGLLVGTVAPALGLRIAGVDLFAMRTPVCGASRLVG